MDFSEIPPWTEEVGRQVVDAAIKVHKELGPGLLESVYVACLAHELVKRGLKVQTQAPLPVHYDGEKIELGFRIDVLVNDTVIVEAKAVEELHPIHQAQLITYLKLSGIRLGYLINFNEVRLKDGLRRFVV